jgi:hypothetical protein
MLATGAGVALASHALKSGTRLLLNTSPEPVSNWVASGTEDGVVIGALALALLHPWLALAAAVAITVALASAVAGCGGGCCAAGCSAARAATMGRTARRGRAECRARHAGRCRAPIACMT